VVNLGTDTEPRWHWRIGDETPTDELGLEIERILRERPSTLQELITFSGARRNRISGVLVRLQVAGVPIVNLGDGRRAVWAIARRKKV